MPTFNVSCDLLVPVLLSVEADTEEEALAKLAEMPKRKLLDLANTEEDSLGILNGSQTAEVTDVVTIDGVEFPIPSQP